MQAEVAQAYENIIRNMLNIAADPRYTPENFTANVSADGQDVVNQVLEQWHFMADFQVEVEAGSMQPLVEQMEQENTLAMVGQLRVSQNIDQLELDREVMKAFRVRDPERLLKDDQNAEAIRSAQMENVAYLLKGGDPGVLEGQDHQSHIVTHDQLEQMAEFQALMPAEQAMALRARDQHKAMHAQAEQQAALPPQQPGKPDLGPKTLTGQVQGNAQKTADAVQAEVANVTER